MEGRATGLALRIFILLPVAAMVASLSHREVTAAPVVALVVMGLRERRQAGLPKHLSVAAVAIAALMLVAVVVEQMPLELMDQAAQAAQGARVFLALLLDQLLLDPVAAVAAR
jgi:hypothetical protein